MKDYTKGSGYVVFLILMAASATLVVGFTCILLSFKATEKADLGALQAKYYARGGLCFVNVATANYQYQASFGGFQLTKNQGEWQSTGYAGESLSKAKAVHVCYE